MRLVAVVVLLALVAAAVVLAQSSAGRTFLRRVHISDPPTGYVQLYFHHPGSLPDYTVARHGHQRIAFGLTNNEQRTRSLHWTIATRGDHPAAQGQLRLRPGQTRIIRRSVLVRCTGRRAYETVRLQSPNESIGYWMACPSPRPSHTRHAAAGG